MTDPNASASMPFPDLWNAVIAQWISDDPQQPQFPAITQRQGALLDQIEPEVLAGHYMILKTTSRLVREEVETKLNAKICDVFSKKLGQDIQLSINIIEPTEPSSEATTSANSVPRSEAGTPQDSAGQVSRAQLAEEHARSYQASTEYINEEPSPTPESWGKMVSPGLREHDRGFQPPNPAQAAPTQGSRQGSEGERLASRKENDVQPPAHSKPAQPTPAGPGNEDEVFLNPSYTFENFVTGSSNQLAYAACRAVAEYPGNSYNPLLIWGESGLGKTHLLHAIGHYARELRPNMRIKYVSSEELTNDFINSISTGARDDFKRRYRNLDLLIVDDAQFLQGKESTQEEFFHTFNALYQTGKQIVLSSDRPPRQLTTLEDRLRTRFESGLITDVQSPDLETRMAILSTKSTVELPQDVKELIASRYEKSIRELEGALIRVVAYCNLGKEPLSMQAAEAALRHIMPGDGDIEITPELIIEIVSEFFSLTPDEIVGKGRARQVANARQIAMYLGRELTDLSLPKLGQAFGGRDHTTVMYSERRIHDKIQEDHKTFNQVQELTQRIKARARN
ncbi:chromosomal replication initiator protein DnaA [Corynebacterium dentalis]|nr:chromosomal replication initiator protein DnaA [Corynebacterium dentalis]